MRLVKWCIYAVFLHIAIHAGNMNISGPYDLNSNRLDEVLLFTTAVLRYVEIQHDGTHSPLWQIKPEDYIIKDALIYDLDNDGDSELIILVDYLPGYRKNSNKWLHVYTWRDSVFIARDLVIDNGEVLHANNADIDTFSGIVSAAVGSPYRAAVLLQANEQRETLNGNTIHIHLPFNLHNGFGPIFTNFINVDGKPYLVVFSPENDSLKTALFSTNNEFKVTNDNSFPLNGALKLLGSATQKTDLDMDSREELQIPFASGQVMTLAYYDSVLTLTESIFSGENLFILPESTSAENINTVITSRVNSGIYDLFMAKPEPGITIIPEDTLRLGDTLHYQATMDTTTGFYSFHWLAQPPERAYFDPTSGYINWIPKREDIGVHEFKFYAEQRLKEELVSDIDALGDRHRIMPVIEEAEHSYAIIVVDTTKPPIIYTPPPYEPYMVFVHTPPKEKGEDRFVFNGVPSFHMLVEDHKLPKYPSVSHNISANLGQVITNKNAEFSYVARPDSMDKISVLTLNHNLTNNEFTASISPHVDSLIQDLDPSNWQSKLSHYPSYQFEGFPESLRLAEAENSILIYNSENEKKTKNNSYISVRTPLADNRHNLSIYMRAIELWDIAGEIVVDSIGNKTVNTTITFSGEFHPYRINSEMYTDADIAKRQKEMKFKILEFMGVDSVAVDSVAVDSL